MFFSDISLVYIFTPCFCIVRYCLPYYWLTYFHLLSDAELFDSDNTQLFCWPLWFRAFRSYRPLLVRSTSEYFSSITYWTGSEFTTSLYLRAQDDTFIHLFFQIDMAKYSYSSNLPNVSPRIFKIYFSWISFLDYFWRTDQPLDGRKFFKIKKTREKTVDRVNII